MKQAGLLQDFWRLLRPLFKGIWEKLLYPPLNWLQGIFYGWLDRRNYRTVLVWAFIRMLPIHFLSLLTGFFLLLNTSQGNEFFLVLADCAPITQFINLLVALFIWAVTLWYSARIILYLLDIESYVNSISSNASVSQESSPNNNLPNKTAVEDTAYCLMLWTPRVLGFLPFLLVFAGFLSNHGRFGTLFSVVFDSLLYFIFIVFRPKMPQQNTVSTAGSTDSVSACRADLTARGYDLKTKNFYDMVKPVGMKLKGIRLKTFLSQNVNWWTRTILLIYGITAMVYVVILCTAPAASIQLGPAAVVISSFALFVGWASVLAYWRERARFPVFGVILLLIIWFSSYNNNHVINKLDYTDLNPRKDLHTHFNEWYQWKKTHHAYNDSLPGYQPVYLLAMEGGGIRGVDFAGNMMHLLDTIPQFSDRLFSVTGASGGMVGAVFYQAWKYALDKSFVSDGGFNKTAFRDFVSDDYLSYLLGAYLFPEFLQRICPVPLKWTDRGQWFEQSIKENFATHFPDKNIDNTVMSMPFLDMWRDTNRYRYPAYFINGAVVETGQRATYSNVILDGAIFPNTLDIHALIGGDVSVSTAATFSCRFPYILPSATVKNPSGQKKANIVDGGYVENTGIVLCREIIDALKDEFERHHLYPVIIFVKNSSLDIVEQSEFALPDESRYSDLMIDYIAPPKALISQWDGLTIRTIKETQLRASRDPKFKFLIFNLDHGNSIRLPLGWMMSPEAVKEIHRQVDQVPHPRQMYKIEVQNNAAYNDLWKMDTTRVAFPDK